MKQIKKERGIPLYLVEFFDYDYDQNILTIQMQSGNKRDFPYVTEEIYNQFKEAMANDASLFTLYTEHTNFSDIKPLEVKDIPTVNKNSEADNDILKVESTVEEANKDIPDLKENKCDDVFWVLARERYGSIEYHLFYDDMDLFTVNLDSASRFKTREEALDRANKVNFCNYIPILINSNYKDMDPNTVASDILKQIDNYEEK